MTKVYGYELAVDKKRKYSKKDIKEICELLRQLRKADNELMNSDLMNKKELIALYEKYFPRFELLPNESINLSEALEYYKKKLREFKILVSSIDKSGYEIPEFLLKKGFIFSAKIRQLETMIKFSTEAIK